VVFTAPGRAVGDTFNSSSARLMSGSREAAVHPRAEESPAVSDRRSNSMSGAMPVIDGHTGAACNRGEVVYVDGAIVGQRMMVCTEPLAEMSCAHEFRAMLILQMRPRQSPPPTPETAIDQHDDGSAFKASPGVALISISSRRSPLGGHG